MKICCHFCGEITADVRDASIAKGSVMVCPHCVATLFGEHKREKRGDATDSMPGFMSDVFRGMKR